MPISTSPASGGRYDCMDAGGRTTPGAVVEDRGTIIYWMLAATD